MPSKTAIGRVGLVSVLAIIIVIAAVGVYAYRDTSQMTADTASNADFSVSTSYFSTTHTSSFIKNVSSQSTISRSSNQTCTSTLTVLNSSAIGTLCRGETTLTQTTTDLTNQTNSLEFSMSLNSSTVQQQNDDLAVSVNLFNTLLSQNNVTGASNWRLTNESEVWPGHWNCAQNDVFRIEVLQGYYDLNNFTNGSALNIFNYQYPPGVNGTNICLYFIRGSAQPMFFTYSENYYVFKPQSNEAQWTASGFQTANQAVVMNESVIVRPALFTNSTGLFTIVGGDEWGHLSLLHFIVTNATEQSSCCTDPKLNLSIPCSIILMPNYPPVQRMLDLIETNPNFTAAENGLNYTNDGSLGCGFAINPGQFNGTTVDFTFTYTTNTIYTDNCGYVGNNTDYLRVKVPLTATGYNMYAIQISSFNSSGIIVTCTSSLLSTDTTIYTTTTTSG